MLDDNNVDPPEYFTYILGSKHGCIKLNTNRAKFKNIMISCTKLTQANKVGENYKHKQNYRGNLVQHPNLTDAGRMLARTALHKPSCRAKVSAVQSITAKAGLALDIRHSKRWILHQNSR